MKTTTKQETDSYNETRTIHAIELDYLNLGNNFTSTHFDNALKDHKEYQEVKDYLRMQDCNDDFLITASGNYGKVSTRETSLYDMDSYFD